MKARQTIKCIYAWTLIAVFTSVLALKAVHFHDTSYHGQAKVSASHQASVGQLCSVCEFTMHEAAAVKATIFVPITVVNGSFALSNPNKSFIRLLRPSTAIRLLRWADSLFI